MMSVIFFEKWSEPIMAEEEVSYIRRDQRQQNMDSILNALDADKLNFNTMILGFTDIMQTSFFNFLNSQARTETERKIMRDRMNKTVNKVMDVLNDNSLSNPEDIVVLTTVMIEAINKALIRQGNEGKVNPVIDKAR